MGAARHARRRAWEHVQGLVRGVVPAGALAHVTQFARAAADLGARPIARGHARVALERALT